MTTTLLSEIVPDPTFDPLRMAVAAYLARYKGHTRVHNESDLRSYLYWYAERGLEPFAARRPDVELYVLWMQEHRLLAPSTISRRIAIVSGFHRTCVIDWGARAFTGRVRAPAERAARVTHPGAEPSAVRGYARRRAGIGQPLRLRVGLPTRPARAADLRSLRVDITDLGEEHGHRVLRVVGKGHKLC